MPAASEQISAGVAPVHFVGAPIQPHVRAVRCCRRCGRSRIQGGRGVSAERRRPQEASAARPEAWERKPGAEVVLRLLRRRAGGTDGRQCRRPAIQEQQQLSKGRQDREKSGPPKLSANLPPIYDENFARRAGQIVARPRCGTPIVSSFHYRRQLFAKAAIAGVTRCGIAMRWRAAFTVREDQCPHPWRSYWVLASIVYEFTIISRFITEQKPKHPRMSADWRR